MSENRLETLLRGSNRYQNAEEILVLLIQYGREGEALKFLGDFARHLGHSSLENNNQLPFRLLIWKTRIELECKGKLVEAKKVYDSVLEQQETNKLAMIRRIAIEKTRKDWKSCTNLLSLYLDVYQGDVDAWLELSRIYLGLRAYGMALFCVEEAILLKPQDYCLLMRYAEIHYAVGTEESLQISCDYFAKVINIVPFHVRALFGLLQANRVLAEIKKSDSSTASEWQKIDHSVQKKLEKASKDYESYVLSAFLPGSMRDLFWVIRAFNAETAKSQTSIGAIGAGSGSGKSISPPSSFMSNSTKSMMRVQYWKDEIRKIYEAEKCNTSTFDNPISRCLWYFIREEEIPLSKIWFTKVLSARQKFCESASPFSSVSEMENYVDATGSSLHYLILDAFSDFAIAPTLTLNDDGDDGTVSKGKTRHLLDHYASHVGKASGILTLLGGAFHYSAVEHIFPFPGELLTKHNLSEQDFYLQELGLNNNKSNNNQDDWNNFFFEIASLANSHLDLALKERNKIFAHLKSDQDPVTQASILTLKLKNIDASYSIARVKARKLLNEDLLARLRYSPNLLTISPISIMWNVGIKDRLWGVQ